MSGGKPGEFPAFDADVIPGGALNLYDPFGWSKNRSEEDKAKRENIAVYERRIAELDEEEQWEELHGLSLQKSNGRQGDRGWDCVRMERNR